MTWLVYGLFALAVVGWTRAITEWSRRRCAEIDRDYHAKVAKLWRDHSEEQLAFINQIGASVFGVPIAPTKRADRRPN